MARAAHVRQQPEPLRLRTASTLPSRTAAHALPVRLAWSQSALHDWILERPILPSEPAGLFGVCFRCSQCELQRLVMVNAAKEIISDQLRQPGRTGWASLVYLRPSCPPTPQDLLWLERIADDGR